MTRNNPNFTQKILTIVLISIVMITAACSKTIVRENILSSIETGIGLSLSENKQTQMYELKAGYFRSQFYSIPTGKVVEVASPATFITMSACRKIANTLPYNQAQAFLTMSSCRKIVTSMRTEELSNAANVTPEVVSGIRSKSGIQDILLGMEISESFAVGKEAVNSPAAVAMYIAMADDAKKSEAAANAVNAMTYDSNDSSVQCIDAWLNKDKNNIKILNDWWKQNSFCGIGALAVKAKDNSAARAKFLEKHPEIKCEQ